jgi:two-component system KDP operon response regulator KdpE
MSKVEILIIDDEPQIRKLLEITLESHNYKVWQAETGKEGIIMAANHPPELILLDIGLPDKSGHEILKELRTWYNKSIIILSVQNSEADIVSALDSGATDYLTKPFRSAELMARIRSAIRRNQTSTIENKIVCDDLEIDVSARVVKKNEVLLKLTSTEFNLLVLFVGTLRKKIEINPNQPKHIFTESGVGYRFT